MSISEDILSESLEGEPVGETVNFVWFISEIGIIALEKDNNEHEKFPEKEALKINLDLCKEEVEYYFINEKKLILYYSKKA